MTDRPPSALARDLLRWINLAHDIRTRDADEHASRQLRTARAVLQRLYGPNGVPGVILGDEVGMGKTYEALAIIAALFRHQPSSRILVLTHSHPMATTWMDRWDRFRSHAVGRYVRPELPEGELLHHALHLGGTSLGFASYDRLKRMPAQELRCALERCFQGRYLRAPDRRRLARELLDTDIAPHGGDVADRVPQGALDRFWRAHFDPDHRTWSHPWTAARALRGLVYRASRTKRRVDLLVVDEAHKVASRQRSMFFAEVLGSRAERALYVTATPFSLSIDQLYDRIEDIHIVTGGSKDHLEALWKDLERFRDAVVARSDLPRDAKHAFEERLRRYLVRSLWANEIQPGVKRRTPTRASSDDLVSDERRAYAMLGLETALVQYGHAGGKTHSVAHRETLCSSYAAIREAASVSHERNAGFASQLDELVSLLPPKGDSPKFEAVVSYLAALAHRREKAVVFCGRLATVRALRKALHVRVQREMDAEREGWTRVRARLRRLERTGRQSIAATDMPRLRLAVHSLGVPAAGQEAKTLRKLGRLLDQSGEPGEAPARSELWDQSWGPRRRVDWVGVLAGGQSEGETRRSAEAVQFAFNLPGPPYVLLCTEIAREGIDLHLWCRRVVQYDLEWNPALMEQQIGRVDRIGSLSRRISQPIEVVWAWVPGTYEEFMARKVGERMEMMRVLLGAGEWLAASPEEQASFADLDRYRLDFSP